MVRCSFSLWVFGPQFQLELIPLRRHMLNLQYFNSKCMVIETKVGRKLPSLPVKEKLHYTEFAGEILICYEANKNVFSYLKYMICRETCTPSGWEKLTCVKETNSPQISEEQTQQGLSLIPMMYVRPRSRWALAWVFSLKDPLSGIASRGGRGNGLGSGSGKAFFRQFSALGQNGPASLPRTESTGWNWSGASQTQGQERAPASGTQSAGAGAGAGTGDYTCAGEPAAARH